MNFKQRLGAILAADAANYSRLMAADEHATLAALDASRAVFKRHIESNQGRVIDMAGDSVLAVFEATLGAVNAALAIQGELGPARDPGAMRFRIGVHLGDVIEKPDGSIYGDGVNIAARLQALAEPGGICVSDAVRSAVRGRLAGRFEDCGEQQLKNIAEPVRTFTLRSSEGAAEPMTAVGQVDLPLPDRPSIAVLPFANLSGDATQDYLADGITEDIITELSRFRSLFVIARNSSFTYKGKAIDVRSVAKELGVRYVLEGSIRRAEKRIRLTGQLVDALTGAHVWAERYDRVVEDVFVLQEELTRSIVTAIAPQIEAAEIAKVRRVRPGNLTAYEIAMHALADAWMGYADDDRAARDRAVELAHKALAIDPRSLVGLRALAFAQWQHLYFGTAASRDSARDVGLDAAGRMIAIDSSDPQGHMWKGTLLYSSESYEAGLAAVRRAYELNPNDPVVLQCLAWPEAGTGNPQKAIEHLNNALRLSPRDFARYNTLRLLGFVCFVARDYESGVRWIMESLQDAPKSPQAHMTLALCYVGLGQIEKAKSELEMVLRLKGEYFLSSVAVRSHFARLEDRQRSATFVQVAAGRLDPSAADKLR